MAVSPNLVQRRVPQFLAIYLGVAWGVVEFVSFIEERYALSPHLTDFALLALALLIPSVVLLTYNHGRPGRDEWVRSEKVGVPLNLAGAAVVLFLVFGSKELGAATESVTVQDETGQTVERTVAKASFRQRLAIFNFDASAGDTSTAWLRYALPNAVTTDLAQNMFLDVRVSAHFREKLRQLGFNEEVDVPLSLKQTIADEQHLPYFVSGRITRSGDQITAEVTLYETARGTIVRERTFTGGDVLALADEIAAALAEDLGLPQTAQVKDLPVAELLTSQPTAFRHYMDGIIAIQIGDQWAQGGELLEQAVAADPSFALAWLNLHNVYLLTNRADQAMPPLQKAMDHLYRLPERLHYDVKAEYYFMRRELDKALAVTRMKVDLYPEDVSGYVLLAQFQRLDNDRTGMIASYRRILELDPAQQEILSQLGALYEELGDFDNALNTYTLYAERFAEKPEAFLSIADLQQSYGHHDAAREQYEKALLISTGNVAAMVGLARLDVYLGRFDEALAQFEEALASARSAEDRARALGGLASWYEFRGQLARSLEYRADELEEIRRTSPPLLVVTRQLQQLGTYVRAGRADEARRILERLSGQLQPPFDAFAALGEMQLELARERPDEAERAVAGSERAIDASGYQFLRTDLVYARGRIAELRGACDQAITHYEQSRELEPWSAVINYHIGRCSRKLGQLQQSIELHQRTLNVIPYHGPANYEIGLSYLEAGDRARALEHLRRAAETWSDADPAYRLAAEAKEKLRQVEAGN
jgi:tetratricopeptide (TPR) repeat protein